jgi:thiol-disulfide isomerase/thioredoxin
MKKILLSIAVLASVVANAQLAPYSMAPDFTATDIDGVEHNLQTYLDEGKTVIMDVSATWCGPCWAFHEAGVLDDVHNTYGPEGTNEVVVLFIEGDGSTGADDLVGDTPESQGDWTTSDYPIIDNADIADDYEIAYFPTIYAICPSGFVIEIGQADPSTGDYWTPEAMVAHATSICPLAESNVDASVWSTNFPVTQPCGVGTPGMITPEVLFINNGFDAITNLTFKTYVDGTLANTDNITGNYDQYDSDWVTLSEVEVSAGEEVTVTVETTGDSNADNNEQVIPYNFMAIGGVVGTTPLLNDLSSDDLTTDGWAYVDVANDGSWIGWFDQGENGLDGSVFFYFYYAPNGQVERFISPSMDLSGMTNAYCNFAYTKCNYANGAGPDKLEIQVSTNCGASWSTVWSKSGAQLDTEPATNANWAPTGSENWASASADLSQWAGQEDVLVSFTGTSGYGNNLFIDNINISNIPSNVAEQVETFNTGVYPNPTNNIVTINAERNTTVTIFDATGKLVETSLMNNPVQTINLKQFGTGLYMIQLSHNGQTATHRVMVQE